MPNEPFTAQQLDQKLRRVEAYWRSLIRGANDLPFWDDFGPSELQEMSPDVLLVNVFSKPLRFRFDSIVGNAIEARYGRQLADRFSDEIEPSSPLEFFNAQASATIESHKPTLHQGAGYRRLLLPMWGDGRVSMLLGAFAWE
jgi:hypothetical protein